MIEITELINLILNEQLETISKNSGIPIKQIKLYATQNKVQHVKLAPKEQIKLYATQNKMQHVKLTPKETNTQQNVCVGVCGKSFGSQDLNEHGECLECETGVAMCVGFCGRWLDPQDSNEHGECGKCEYKRVNKNSNPKSKCSRV